MYQSRFKSFPVQDDEHFLVICRYVELNPLRAGLVARAEDWPHGSLHRWVRSLTRPAKLVSPWPTRRSAGWVERVNEALSDNELAAIRTCIDRGRLFGDDTWIEQTAEEHGLWHTLRPGGRPRKRPAHAAG